MDKQTFIRECGVALKSLKFRKNRNYWYKEHVGYLLCLNFQNSQWSNEVYYVNFGIAFIDASARNPTILQWFCRHRVQGDNGEKNITVDELLEFLSDVQREYPDVTEITEYIVSKGARLVVNQYWF